MRFFTLILSIVVIIGWGIVSPIARYLVFLSDQPIIPLALALYRYVFGFITLLLIHLYQKRGRKEKFPAYRYYPKSKLVAGGFLVAIFAIVLFFGLERTSASIGGLLLNSNSILVGLFAFLILREKILKNQIIALVTGFVGVIVVMLPGLISTEPTLNTPLGNILTFGSGVIWAFYSIVLRAWFNDDDLSLEVMTIHLGIGAIMLLPFIILATGPVIWGSLLELGLILVLGIWSTALSYSSYLIIINRESVVLAGSLQFAVPAVNIIISYLVFAEQVILIEWIGIVIISLAMYIALFLGSKQS